MEPSVLLGTSIVVDYFFRMLGDAVHLFLTFCAFILQLLFGCDGGKTAALVFQVVPLLVLLFSLNLNIWKITVFDFAILGGGVSLLTYCPTTQTILEDLSMLLPAAFPVIPAKIPA